MTGGKDVGLDDIGARASVALYYEGKQICGGVVYKDRYILTTAHCFTDGKGNLEIDADEIEVLYWSSGKARRDARTVEEI
ncbi:MAG TPA: trypsin-like serine protease, partial [Steroidobacteraceae bacterium]|nr:trypsin-like serine protease [Steroidobacteraceae bacterium]